MRNPSGHRGENERVKKSEQQQVPVSRSFTLWSSKTTAKKCTKKVCCTCKVVFLPIRLIVVFSPFSLSSPLSIT